MPGGGPGLLVRFAPLLAVLLMIAIGAVADAVGVKNAVLSFIANPVVALLTGLVGTVLVARPAGGREGVERAVVRGFRESGQIRILAAVGGSLAAVVTASGLGGILRGCFTAGDMAPLLLIWAVAAVLHMAIGSVAIPAITAAGILAPIAPALGLDPVLVARAVGAGSLFAVHVTSNTFWLLKSLMGGRRPGARSRHARSASRWPLSWPSCCPSRRACCCEPVRVPRPASPMGTGLRARHLNGWFCTSTAHPRAF